MKLICEYPAGTLRNATTSSNIAAVASAVKSMPGVGKPFLVFASLAGPVAIAAFDLYPDYVVSSDVSVNTALINQMLETPPTDALTFA
jgi:hypothetical protein